MFLILAPSDAAAVDRAAAAQSREDALYQRYLQILLRSPRPGTAFDKVFDYHQQRNSLSTFAEQLRQTEGEGEAGSALMVLGLLHQKQDQHAEAAAAFEQAAQLRPADPVSARYWGEALLATESFDQAAAALEAALQRDPARIDQLDIFQTLGRLYQQTRQLEKAIEIYKRLESAFPQDRQVQESVAEVLLAGNLLQEALQRYELLASSADSPQQSIEYSLQAAEIEARMGDHQAARTRLAGLSRRVRPGSYLHQQIRQRLEQTYRSQSDFDGLIAHYETVLQRDPTDVDAAGRLASVLLVVNRAEDADQRLRQAIELAPRNPQLREQLIQILLGRNQLADAINQYASLAELTDLSFEQRAAWGRLVLKQEDLPAAERETRALAIWSELTTDAADDPVAVVQVANLYRSAGMYEAAHAAFQRAVELAPDDVRFYEYLGEFLHSNNRPAEAVNAWQQMAAGARRTPERLNSLVGVLQQYNYQQPALEALQTLTELQPTADHHLRLARLLRTVGQFESALQHLDAAATRSEADHQAALTQERILVLRDSGKLKQAATSLRQQLQSSDSAAAEDWKTAALYFEALGDLTAASEAVSRAIERSTANDVLTIAVRIFERAGALDRAAQTAEQLAEQDSAYRSVHLKTLLRLQADLGQRNRIPETAKRLIAAAPDNEDSYRFAADLLLRLGDFETALELLQRATSGSSVGIDLLRQYADTLATLFETDRAIDTSWRVFDRTQPGGQRLDAARQLAKLYKRSDRVDDLLDKLQQRLQAEPDPVPLQQVLAVVLQEVGQLVRAEQVLKQAVQTQPNNAELWSQLAEVAEQRGQLVEAADYQRRVTELDSSLQATEKLATLLQRAGQLSEAEADWLKYSHAGRSPAEALASIDRLLLDGRLPLARRLIDQRLTQTPDHWELLLRAAVADRLAKSKQPTFFTAHKLQELHIDPESPAFSSVLRPSAVSQSPQPRAARISKRLQQLTIFLKSRQAGEAVPWAATDLEEAIAIASLLAAESLPEQTDFAAFEQQLTNPSTRRSEWRSWYAAEAWNNLRPNDRTSQRPTARSLANRQRPEACFLWLHILSQDPHQLNQPDVKLTEHCWRVVTRHDPDWLLHLQSPTGLLNELASVDARAAENLRTELQRPDASAAELQVALQDVLQRDQLMRYVSIAARLKDITGQDEAFARHMAAAVWKAAGTKDSELGKQVVSVFLTEQIAHEPPRAPLESLELTVSTNFRLHHDQNRPAVVRDTAIAFDEHWPRFKVEFLVNAREAFRHQKSFDLTQQVAAFAEERDGYAAYVVQTALAHLAWLNGEQSTALQHLVKAAAHRPADEALRLRLAQHYRTAGFAADALRLLNTGTSRAHDLVAAREFLALKIATELQQQDRMKLAAERLLGLRLAPDEATRLAERLAAAKLDEYVNQLQQRSDRFSDDLPRLVRLMDTAIEDKNTTAAAEVARQILTTTRGLTRGPKNGRSLPAIRADAIRAVAAAGQLHQLLSTLNDQLAERPGDVRLLEAKLEILTAVNHSEVAEQVRDRLQSVQPRSVERLLKQAAEFERVRNDRAAVDLLLEVLQQDPQRFSANYYQYLKTFARAGRTSELADALMQHDLRKLKNNHYVVNEVIQTLFAESRGRPQEPTSAKALELFEAAWKAFPTNRTFLLTEVDDERVWQLPLMLDYARTALIPQTVQQAAANPWKVITGRLQVTEPAAARRRTVQATLTRFVSAIREQDRAHEFMQLTKTAVEKFPLWYGGRLLLAALQHLDGAHDAATDTLRQVIDSMDDIRVPPDAALLVAQEIQPDAPLKLRQAVVDLLATALREDPAPVVRSYRHTPGALLAERLADLDRHTEAVDAAEAAFQRIDFRALAQDSSLEETVSREAIAAARHLLQLNYSFAAARRLHQHNLLSDRTALPLPRRLLDEARQVRRDVQQNIHAEELLLWMRPDRRPTADPLPHVAASGRLQTHLTDLLSQRARNDSELTERLQSLVMEFPADVLVNAATATVAYDLQNASLIKIVEQNLRQIADETNASRSDRSGDSLADILLWLAVRPKLHQTPSDSVRHLIDRSISATRGLQRSEWTAAILDELGDQALRRGDRTAAKAAWSQLLDVVLQDGPATGDDGSEATHPQAIELLRRVLLNDSPANP